MPRVKFQIQQIAQYYFQENIHAVAKLVKYKFNSPIFIFKPI